MSSIKCSLKNIKTEMIYRIRSRSYRIDAAIIYKLTLFFESLIALLFNRYLFIHVL